MRHQSELSKRLALWVLLALAAPSAIASGSEDCTLRAPGGKKVSISFGVPHHIDEQGYIARLSPIELQYGGRSVVYDMVDDFKYRIDPATDIASLQIKAFDAGRRSAFELRARQTRLCTDKEPQCSRRYGIGYFLATHPSRGPGQFHLRMSKGELVCSSG